MISFFLSMVSLRLRRDNKVVGRLACYGKDVISATRLARLPNFQKSRCDSVISANTRKLSYHELCLLLLDKSLFSVVYRSVLLNSHLPRRGGILVLDTYSELTDQMFIWRGKRFYANYSDIKPSILKNKDLDCRGLLEIGELESSYMEMCLYFEKRDTKLIFIEFPWKFDNRDKFKRRGLAIREALEKMATLFPNTYYLKLDSDLITKDLTDDYPYHISKNTADLQAQKLEILLDEIL